MNSFSIFFFCSWRQIQTVNSYFFLMRAVHHERKIYDGPRYLFRILVSIFSNESWICSQNIVFQEHSVLFATVFHEHSILFAIVFPEHSIVSLLSFLKTLYCSLLSFVIILYCLQQYRIVIALLIKCITKSIDVWIKTNI